ncbi:MAG: DNA alkylation repair protein [Bacteroidetes bacterium]|nr:DNA alkylation repair protein [Bacteroidota bacterium]
MTKNEVMTELEKFGNEGTKRVLMKHGAKEPFFGVKVGDLKKLVKIIKVDHPLAMELYETGNSDAMYLAGLICDPAKMSKEDLNLWLKNAYWYMLSDYTIAWVAAESNHGYELALEWIQSEDEMTASAGWATLSSLMAIKPDEELDIPKFSELLDHVGTHIHEAPNRARYTMNGFVIATGCYVEELTEKAVEVAKKIGNVSVEMGGTACKVPAAPQYIQKVANKGRIGKKRKMARC